MSGLADAMLAQMTSHLDANTTLNAEQQATRLALVESHLDAMVNATHCPVPVSGRWVRGWAG